MVPEQDEMAHQQLRLEFQHRLPARKDAGQETDMHHRRFVHRGPLGGCLKERCSQIKGICRGRIRSVQFRFRGRPAVPISADEPLHKRSLQPGHDDDCVDSPNDFDESLVEYPKEPSNMHIRIKNDSCYEELGTIFPYTIKRYLLKSAIVRYLEYNLIVRVRIKELLGKNNYAYNANINPDTVAARKPKIAIATNYLIRKFKEENPSCELVFLMNAPINDIHNNTVSSSNVVWMNKFAKEIIEKNNLTFVDLTPAFEDNYRKYHGRFDFGDLDGHWNEMGHDIVARAVINYLNAHRN